MDSPSRITSNQQVPAPTSSDISKSPEFEFWRVRHPSLPQPDLIFADELFANGVLLPLHLLHQHPRRPISAHSTSTTSSRRWILDMFNHTTTATTTSSSSSKNHYRQCNDKVKEKENPKVKHRKEKKKKKERKNGSSSAELNINIWPFSRSRSAGNSSAPCRIFSGSTRKASSAPCSRSNSGGESNCRKWASSPGRAGVHLGRSSPIWQVRRLNGKKAESPVIRITSRKQRSLGAKKATVEDITKTRVVNQNVPRCSGCRQHLTCRSHESGRNVNARGGNGTSKANVGRGGGGGGNPFNLRSLFSSKKVY